MTTKSVRVDSDVMEQILTRSMIGETPNQVLRRIFALPEMKNPYGGAVKRSIKKVSPYLARIERSLLKSLAEIRKLREDA